MTKRPRLTKFDALLQIWNLYLNESEKCKKARAYLAGCISLGALLEAGLLAMALSYPQDVMKTRTYSVKKRKKRKKGRIRWLRDFSLHDLLQIARELGWIPSKLPINTVAKASGITPPQALRNGDVGYFADVVRELRNLVHPGKFADEYAGLRVTKKFYIHCYTMIEIVSNYLCKKLEQSIKNQLSL